MEFCEMINQSLPSTKRTGNNTLAANLMARAWNPSSELQAVTIRAARSVARKWAQNLRCLMILSTVDAFRFNTKLLFSIKSKVIS